MKYPLSMIREVLACDSVSKEKKISFIEENIEHAESELIFLKNLLTDIVNPV